MIRRKRTTAVVARMVPPKGMGEASAGWAVSSGAAGKPASPAQTEMATGPVQVPEASPMSPPMTTATAATDADGEYAGTSPATIQGAPPPMSAAIAQSPAPAAGDAGAPPSAAAAEGTPATTGAPDAAHVRMDTQQLLDIDYDFDDDDDLDV